ncbi:MAG: family 78 glycoside hydrolase catalytic domain [Acidimicrobiales bacterium]
MADWIGPLERTVAPPGQRPAWWLRHEFSLQGTPGASLRAASLRLSARGMVEVWCNGVRLGDELLPGYTQYDQRLPLRTLDVGEILVAGPNAIAVLLADGWFRGQTGAMRAADQWGTELSVWLELVVDGRPVVGTGPTWTTGPSHITRADLIGGQAEDRRLVDPTITRPGHAPGDDWHPVVVATLPDAPLVERAAPPVRRVAELRPRSVDELRPGVHVVDLGQNLNGWLRLCDLGPADTEITITHGEALVPGGPDAGDVTTDHLRVDFPFLPAPLPAGQVDEVISAGVDGDTFEPRFTTHGFRYARIEGHPGPLGIDDVVGVAVHSDLERIGTFECNDDVVNRLHDAVVWSLRSNICEIPTDCPHRERAGWTGDWQIFVPTAAFLYDVDAFTRSWLADVRAVQRTDGMIRNHAPATRAECFEGPAVGLQGSAGWGDVIVEAPYQLWQAYGDVDALAESWDAMAAWVEFAAVAAAAGAVDGLWDTGFHWGEWLEPGVDIGDFGAFVAADKSEVATPYLIRSARRLAEIADVLGRPGDDAERYRDLADRCLAAWQAAHLDDAGRVVTQTQAAHVRALAFDLVPQAARQATADHLVELVREAGTTVGTGFLSTPMLLPVLADHGHLDLAHELLTQPDVPGWRAMLDRGATTVWERWEGVDDDGVAHESLNHYSKGAVIGFLHTHVAGLRPTSPGYATFEVRPRPGGSIRRASLTLRSPHGPIEVEWAVGSEGTADDLELRVVVPAGTEATIVLPDDTTHIAGPGDHGFRAPTAPR